ncbi:putative pectinesterase [Trifolium repens]|nr:putative pectinesterase [Trifolium repens]
MFLRLGSNNDQVVALRASGNKKCYIQGIVDFVFGNERSLYEGCTLKSIDKNIGYIMAQSRPILSIETGFSITNSKVISNGQVYLGRLWRAFSRGIFSYNYMENIVLPQGRDDAMSMQDCALREYKCSGPGSNFARRAPSVHRLIDMEVQPSIGIHFIEGDTWLINPIL